MFSHIPKASSGNAVKNAFDGAIDVERGKALEHTINANTALIEKAALLKEDARDAEARNAELRRQQLLDEEQADDIIFQLRQEKIQALRERNAAIEEAKHYKNLLAQPMAAIAEQNHDFKATYEKQQNILAGWMKSQQAWKELALKYGVEELKKDREEVIQEFKAEETYLQTNPTKYPKKN